MRPKPHRPPTDAHRHLMEGPRPSGGFAHRRRFTRDRGQSNLNSISQDSRRTYMRKSFFLLAVGMTATLLFLGEFTFAISMAAAQHNIARAPIDANVVPNGTHFLVRLDKELSTGKNKVSEKFEARTLEPLEASSGYILTPGAKVRGHISRIESGGVTGRARLWLTFDDIDTHHGRVPLVAEVSSVPGDFGVRPGESKEGEIEARTSKGTRDLEAAAAGAALGAAAGASKGGGKGAAIGAAAGGLAGFVASSGIGQEIDLQKGAKLDLVL